MRQILTHLLGVLGLKWSIHEGWWPIIVMVAVAIAVYVAVAWVVGKITAQDPYESEGALMLRGGCLAIPAIGLGLIFVAAVLWAWRYLFGSGYY